MKPDLSINFCGKVPEWSALISLAAEGAQSLYGKATRADDSAKASIEKILDNAAPLVQRMRDQVAAQK